MTMITKFYFYATLGFSKSLFKNQGIEAKSHENESQFSQIFC